jgi:hypothetical protein
MVYTAILVTGIFIAVSFFNLIFFNGLLKQYNATLKLDAKIDELLTLHKKEQQGVKDMAEAMYLRGTEAFERSIDATVAMFFEDQIGIPLSTFLQYTNKYWMLTQAMPYIAVGRKVAVRMGDSITEYEPQAFLFDMFYPALLQHYGYEASSYSGSIKDFKHSVERLINTSDENYKS